MSDHPITVDGPCPSIHCDWIGHGSHPCHRCHVAPGQPRFVEPPQGVKGKPYWSNACETCWTGFVQAREVATVVRDLEAKLQEARRMVLDALGDRWQEQHDFGNGDVEFGERYWTIGAEDFSADAERAPDECLADVERALRAMFGASPRVQDALHDAGAAPSLPAFCPVCRFGRMRLLRSKHGPFLKCIGKGCDVIANLDDDGRLASAPDGKETRDLRKQVFATIETPLADAFGDYQAARRWLMSRHGRIAFMDADACRAAISCAHAEYHRVMACMDVEAD